MSVVAVTLTTAVNTPVLTRYEVNENPYGGDNKRYNYGTLANIVYTLVTIDCSDVMYVANNQKHWHNCFTLNILLRLIMNNAFVSKQRKKLK